MEIGNSQSDWPSSWLALCLLFACSSLAASVAVSTELVSALKCFLVAVRGVGACNVSRGHSNHLLRGRNYLDNKINNFSAVDSFENCLAAWGTKEGGIKEQKELKMKL